MVVKAVSTVVKTYFTAWKTVITTVLKAIGAVVSTAWKGIKAVISPVVSWITGIVPKAFTAVKDKLKSAWSGLKGIAADAFNGITSGVRTPLNAVIGLINSAIGSINGIHVSVPGWVPGVGGKTFGVSIPRIPLLADGGLVMPRSGGVPAILAEAGEAEAVLPLSRLDRLLTRTAVQARLAGAVPGARAAACTSSTTTRRQQSDAGRTADALMFLWKARG